MIELPPEIGAIDRSIVNCLDGSEQFIAFYQDVCRTTVPTSQKRSYTFETDQLAALTGNDVLMSKDIARRRRSFWLPDWVNLYIDTHDLAYVSRITVTTKQRDSERPDYTLLFEINNGNKVELPFERNGDESEDDPFTLKKHPENGQLYQVSNFEVGKTVLGLCLGEEDLAETQWQVEEDGKRMKTLDVQDTSALLFQQKIMQIKASSQTIDRSYSFERLEDNEVFYVTHSDDTEKGRTLTGVFTRTNRMGFEIIGTTVLDGEDSPHPIAFSLNDIDQRQCPAPDSAFESLLLKEFSGIIKRVTESTNEVGLQSTQAIAQQESRVKDDNR